MSVRIKDLRKPVQEIAQKFVNGGFNMIDLVSIGMLFLQDKDGNDIMKLRELINKNGLSAENVLSSYIDEISAQSKKPKKKYIPKRHNSSKAG